MALKLSINRIIIVPISHIIPLTIPPKCVKNCEPKDEQLYIAVHPVNNNICY